MLASSWLILIVSPALTSMVEATCSPTRTWPEASATPVHKPVRVHGVHGTQVCPARDVGLVVDGDGLIIKRGGSDQSARGHLGGRGVHGLVREDPVTGGRNDEVRAVGADLAGHLRGHIHRDSDEAGQGRRADGDGENRDEDAGAAAQDGGDDHPPEHCSSGHKHHLPCRTSAALRRSK